MQMPGMDGLELAVEVRKLPGHAALPLILLMSMGVKAGNPELAAVACAGCLTKPVKPTQLLELLVRAVSGPKSSPQPTVTTGKFAQPLAARLPLRVLVCEDNAISQKVAIRLLQQLGYQPDLAANGREALARLDAQAYDFIFMDLLMPELDGLSATREIRCRQKDAARHPNYGARIAIVAMTACAMPGDREKCLAAGMDDYLAKPVRLKNVRAVIERWGRPTASKGAGDAPPKGTAPVVPEAVSAPTSPPVDLARFRELTDGTEPGFQELASFYLEQTTLEMEQLANAVQRGEAQEVRRIAHSCAGASATCGIVGLVRLLRELERLGDEENLGNAEASFAAAKCEYARIRAFLEPYCRLAPELSAPA
jgi:CheY-like chemotaxis protein